MSLESAKIEGIIKMNNQEKNCCEKCITSKATSALGTVHYNVCIRLDCICHTTKEENEEINEAIEPHHGAVGYPSEEAGKECNSHPLCSHNTNGRSIDNPCSIEFPSPQSWEEESIENDIFLKQWTSVKGANKELIDHVKYMVSAARSAAIEECRKEIAEKVKKIDIGLYHPENIEAYECCRTDVLALLSSTNNPDKN